MMSFELIRYLIKEGITISTAESCTGGLIASKITAEKGASTIFKGGLVTYSNDVKCQFLDITPSFLETYGVVSLETASRMAMSAMSVFNTDIAIATTGYAQPFDGENQHAYIAVAYKVPGSHKVDCITEKIDKEYSKARTRFIEYVASDALTLAVEVVNDKILSKDKGE